MVDASLTLIPGFLSHEEVEMVRAICTELLALPAPQRWPGDKVASGTHHLMGLDQRSSVIDEIVGRHALVDLVTELLGPNHRRDQISYRSPQPGAGGQLLHADDVADLDGRPATVATAIVTLCQFTATNGATRIVPGSRHRPDLQRQSGQLEHHTQEQLITCDAGTAIVFDGNLLHSGTQNRSTDERPALQLVWRRNPPTARTGAESRETDGQESGVRGAVIGRA